jgi:glycine/D-amino acid oxidase-like deaminating enzyme
MTGLDRRRLLQASMLLGGMNLVGLGGCATASSPSGAALAAGGFSPYRPLLAPVRAQADRLFDITVCLRPFRAAGPRLDVEQIGDTLVVHNYGHGGSGWSLSWGSSTLAVQKAMQTSPGEVAVVGCGALGLTSARLAQQAGAKVTIYARDLLPQTRSSRATGSWTPNSRIALSNAVAPGFPALWEQMARTSFKTYRSYLGLPGEPVEWIDYYLLSDSQTDSPTPVQADDLAFASYHDRIRDLTPHGEVLAAGVAPFPVSRVRRSETLMFNVADYGHTLMSDFLAAGGVIRRREFHTPAELSQLPQKVVVNCPGYGARALWRDESVVPVRGQIGWLIPQPEVKYGFFYRDVGVLSRRDGIVVQALDGGDMKGYNNADETPNRAESEQALATIAPLFARPGGFQAA